MNLKWEQWLFKNVFKAIALMSEIFKIKTLISGLAQTICILASLHFIGIGKSNKLCGIERLWGQHSKFSIYEVVVWELARIFSQKYLFGQKCHIGQKWLFSQQWLFGQKWLFSKKFFFARNAFSATNGFLAEITVQQKMLFGKK